MAPLPAPRPGEGRIVVPEAPRGEPGKDTGALVAVKAFRFEGNTQIPDARLMQEVPELGKALGRELSVADLDAIATKVARYYRLRGYLVAFAYLPPQQITNGTVTIAVLEGKLDHVQAKSVGGYTAETLKNYLEEALCDRVSPDCHDSLLETKRAERAVGIVSDLPGIASASGTLSPGRAVGSSDYLLDAAPGKTLSWNLGADNYGSRYIGRERLTGGLRLDNAAGLGERATLNLYSTGRHMNGGTLDANLPIGYGGWRAGLEFSHFQYRLMEPFDAVDAHGDADVLTAYASYPLIRSSASNLYFRGAYAQKWLSDKILGASSDKRAQTTSLELSGSNVDTLLGGGLSAGSLAVVHGQMDYLFPLGFGAKDGSGHFNKLTYAAYRDQTIAYPGPASRVSLYAALRGQQASRNLDSSESFALGGPGSVRAYPQGEAAGDSGKVFTAELRYSTAVPLLGGSDASVALFRDFGWVTINKGLVPGYTGPATRRLAGTGISLSLAKRDAFSIKLMWAARDKHGETATSEPDSRSRFWLQLVSHF